MDWQEQKNGMSILRALFGSLTTFICAFSTNVFANADCRCMPWWNFRYEAVKSSLPWHFCSMKKLLLPWLDVSSNFCINLQFFVRSFLDDLLHCPGTCIWNSVKIFINSQYTEQLAIICCYELLTSACSYNYGKKLDVCLHYGRHSNKKQSDHGGVWNILREV